MTYCHHQTKKTWEDRARAAIALWLDGNRPLSETYTIGDFGCGNGRLKPLLERELGSRLVYRGYDKNPQHPETQAIDLEAAFPAGVFDAVFCLGLIEYLNDAPVFFRRLNDIARQTVVSYTVSDSGAYSPEQVREKGWVSHASVSEMEAVFSNASFGILSKTAIDKGKTVIWLLANRRPGSAR